MVTPLTQDALLQVWVCLKEPSLPTACSEAELAQPEAGDSGGESWPPAACYVFLDSARNLAPCTHHCASVYASQSYKYFFDMLSGLGILPSALGESPRGTDTANLLLFCGLLTVFVDPGRRFAYWGPNPTLLLLSDADMVQQQ